MSHIKKNVVTHGLSGKVDTLVFRQRSGKTIVATAPGERAFTELNAAQKAVRSAFKKAITYAKAAITNLQLKQAYKEKAKAGQSAYNRATVDFFNAPEIDEIDNSLYTGQVGNVINVPVTDDFRVASVHFKIEKPDGSLLEQGNAVADADGLHWMYSATIANSNVTGSIITVTAKDLPGNSVSKTKTI